PYGNPIPGLAELDADRAAKPPAAAESHLASPDIAGPVVVRRISESVQTDVGTLRQLHAAGIDPGATIRVAQGRDEVVVDGSGEPLRLPLDLAARVFVTPADAAA